MTKVSLEIIFRYGCLTSEYSETCSKRKFPILQYIGSSKHASVYFLLADHAELCTTPVTRHHASDSRHEEGTLAYLAHNDKHARGLSPATATTCSY